MAELEDRVIAQKRRPLAQGELDDRIGGTGRSEPLVYFVQCAATGLIKIGSSGDYEQRLILLRSQSPVPLLELGFVRGGRELEKQLHRRFRASRDHGEWFRPSADLIAYIEEESVIHPAAARWFATRAAASRDLLEGNLADWDAWLLEDSGRRIYDHPASPPTPGTGTDGFTA